MLQDYQILFPQKYFAASTHVVIRNGSAGHAAKGLHRSSGSVCGGDSRAPALNGALPLVQRHTLQFDYLAGNYLHVCGAAAAYGESVAVAPATVMAGMRKLWGGACRR